MGADIYLKSVNERCMAEWKPKFEQAAAVRNAKYPQQGNGPEYDALQAAVSEVYDGMYSEGYFRDSYNATSLFGVLGLSWWQSCGEGELIEDGYMQPAKCAELLKTLDATPVTPTLMRGWKSRNSGYATIDDGDNSVESWRQMFERKRETLMSLLKQAIELNEPLYCSV